MSGDKRLKNDKVIDELLETVERIVKRHGIRCDWHGQWFSMNQLDAIRYILETKGWKVARMYQVGKIDPRDRPFDLKKNQALLEIIDAVASSDLERPVASYAIGKLNSMLAERLLDQDQGGQRSGKRR